MDTKNILSMARAMTAHATARQTIVARNVAHADTPGYKAADLPDFAEVWRHTPQGGLRTTRPGHMGADFGGAGFGPAALRPRADPRAEKNPNGNTVSLETEMMRAADIRREHELSISIYKSALGLMRASLGRK